MPSRRSAETWSVVHPERRALIIQLESLTLEQWALPSLCPGWDIHDVVAHLVDCARTTRIGFVRRMIAARLDFDEANARGVLAERTASPAATLAAFRRVSANTMTPPAALPTRLVEAIVHGEDIRRPLGLARSYPIGAVDAALRHQLRTGVAMGGGKECAAGFSLRATDSPLHLGSGPEVAGSSLALLLAVSGRTPVDGHFSGNGAAAFTRRLQREVR